MGWISDEMGWDGLVMGWIGDEMGWIGDVIDGMRWHGINPVWSTESRLEKRSLGNSRRRQPCISIHLD